MKKNKIIVLEKGMSKLDMDKVNGGSCDTVTCGSNYSTGACLWLTSCTGFSDESTECTSVYTNKEGCWFA
jgi:hypothetical protein